MACSRGSDVVTVESVVSVVLVDDEADDLMCPVVTWPYIKLLEAAIFSSWLFALFWWA